MQFETEVHVVKAERNPSCVSLSTQICEMKSLIGTFLDSEFDGQPGLTREFPLLMGGSRNWVVRTEQEIVAHSAWAPMALVSYGERVRAAGIGLVTTHRDWRGRGLATQLVEACVLQAAETGAEICLLFGAPRSLYARLGFVMAGRERVSRVVADEETGKEAIRLAVANDIVTLHALYETHRCRVERSVEQFHEAFEIPSTHIYVHEHAGEVLAYCVEGKGRDLQGIIHEWAGPSEAVRTLLAGVAALHGDPLWVLSPDSEPAPLDDECRLGAFAQIRILDPARFGTDDPVQAFGDPEHPAFLPIYAWGLDSI